MKKLTEILKLSKLTSHKAVSYYDAFIAGMLTLRAFDSLREADYKNFILYGGAAVVLGLSAYVFNKRNAKK